MEIHLKVAYTKLNNYCVRLMKKFSYKRIIYWQKRTSRKVRRLWSELRSNRRQQIFVGGLLAILLIGFASYLWWLRSDYNYSRGVLALNTDQSSYLAGETVLLQMASLDKNGDTLCDSNLKLQISVPKQWKTDTLLYQGTQIITTATCSPDNTVTNEPDYIARYVTSQPGKYKIKLINTDTGKQVKSEFQVYSPDVSEKNNQPTNFQIQRFSATRINPLKSDRYPMVIMVTTKQDFKGKLVESVPLDFKFQWIGSAQVTQDKKNQIVTWDVELKAGESKEFAYEYDAPDKSPGFIHIGKAKLLTNTNKQTYTESRHWLVASE